MLVIIMLHYNDVTSVCTKNLIRFSGKCHKPGHFATVVIHTIQIHGSYVFVLA